MTGIDLCLATCVIMATCGYYDSIRALGLVGVIVLVVVKIAIWVLRLVMALF